MNITKRYIQMCNAAKPIQDSWFPRFGDYYWLGKEYLCIPDACRIITESSELIKLQYNRKEQVWLPQSDQIFKLLGGVTVENLEKLVSTKKFYNSEFKNQRDLTLEELVLATYMFHKHNKFWNGEKWVMKN